MTAPRLVEDFFRREYAKLVASLSRRVGVQYIESVEDAAQAALANALHTWHPAHPPDNASAWLYRAASNHLLGELRRRGGQRRILAQHRRALRVRLYCDPVTPGALFTNEVGDDLLRMLFVCCDGALPVQAQLVMALKTLCGFSVREIASRLFVSEANVYKRVQRARDALRQARPEVGVLEAEDIASRLPAVRAVLYTLFAEGHLSSHLALAIRQQLCGEAMRLATLLANHPVGCSAESRALVALMHLHAARIQARQGAMGGLILLQEQDRSAWDLRQIQLGIEWLAQSAHGDALSRYHIEAGIAAEHCLASSFGETRWDRIVEAYRLLDQVAPSPMNRLNGAVALAEWKGPFSALATLEGFEPPAWFVGSHYWSAVLADLHRRSGHRALAARYRDLALSSAPSDPVRDALRRRLCLEVVGASERDG